MALVLPTALFLVSVVNCQLDYFELLTTQQQVTDYYIKYDALPIMSALSACAWFRTTSRAGTLSIISYATTDTLDNDIWMGLEEPGLSWYIGTEHQITQVQNDLIRDGRWHHMCATWNGQSGRSTIYLDSYVEKEGSISSDYVIAGGGTLVIGQDQDVPGGEFDQEQSFVGALADVNLYDKELDPNEVSFLSSSCDANKGTIFKWSDVRGGLRGNIQVLPSSLQPSKCDTDGGV